jgi:hypothetical protein
MSIISINTTEFETILQIYNSEPQVAIDIPEMKSYQFIQIAISVINKFYNYKL